ncbi:hypothetical protein ACQPXS_16875 [Streptomyces sp. CA-142005]|uniref:hypothetical protein n=1 Tax=Streptomyces sp. CA-142005 TaxID=3240052 RepID=UPI003D93FE66
MAFGSYWTGIRMVELDPGTGKAVPGAEVHHLATRPDAPYAVEGAAIVRHGRYIGPGGESAFRTHGTTWLTCHYYDADDNGTPKLGLNQLGRRSDWPVPK